jgi:hypothetical protein
MLVTSRQPVPPVIHQHTEASAILRRTRSVLVQATHVSLLHLARLDERIAAHLDGVAVAGEYGSRLCEAALETPGVGEVFAAALRNRGQTTNKPAKNEVSARRCYIC